MKREGTSGTLFFSFWLLGPLQHSFQVLSLDVPALQCCQPASLQKAHRNQRLWSAARPGFILPTLISFLKISFEIHYLRFSVFLVEHYKVLRFF